MNCKGCNKSIEEKRVGRIRKPDFRILKIYNNILKFHGIKREAYWWWRESTSEWVYERIIQKSIHIFIFRRDVGKTCFIAFLRTLTTGFTGLKYIMGFRN